jgi:hypothetical protein
MLGNFPFSLLLNLLFRNLYLLYSNGLHLRTHLFCVGQHLHLKEKELQIAGEVIPMSLGTGIPLVSEKETGVSLVKGCKVPPNLVMRVGAQLSESLAGKYIVKAATKGEILIPRSSWVLPPLLSVVPFL